MISNRYYRDFFYNGEDDIQNDFDGKCFAVSWLFISICISTYRSFREGDHRYILVPKYDRNINRIHAGIF